MESRDALVRVLTWAGIVIVIGVMAKMSVIGYYRSELSAIGIWTLVGLGLLGAARILTPRKDIDNHRRDIHNHRR